MGNHRTNIHSCFYDFGVFARTFAGDIPRWRQHYQCHFAYDEFLRTDYRLLPKVRQKSGYRHYHSHDATLYNNILYWLDTTAYRLGFVQDTIRTGSAIVLWNVENGKFLVIKKLVEYDILQIFLLINIL